MLSALFLAAAMNTVPPLNSTATGGAKPIHGTSAPLLRKAAPKPNPNATAGPLLREAAPGASPRQAGNPSLRTFSGAGTQPGVVPGTHGQSANWGWFGLFGVFGLAGLWRRYSGS